MPNTKEKGKLIKVLSKHIPYGYATLCLIAEELMAEGVTVQEWISVKDRLPQDDLPFGALCEIVQVLLDDRTVTVGWCNRGLKCWYYMPIQATNFVGHDYDKTPVVAWRPLAQPPKGE